jgi:hypothetical protein
MRIGLIFFPPLINVEYAFVICSKVVSAEPNDTDNSSGISL